MKHLMQSKVVDKKLEDVMFIGSQDGKYRMSLAKFLTLSNFTYDCGYGAPEIAGDLIVYFNDNTYMTRGEYDGSEWWEYNEPLVYDKEEILKLIKILKISYPSYFRELQDDEIVLMTQLWERKFKNYSLDQVSNAIDNLTSKSKFMPSISEVLSEIIQMSTPQLNPYSEWENVLKGSKKVWNL